MKRTYSNTRLALLCAALLLTGCAQQTTDTAAESTAAESATQESAAASTSDSINTVAAIDTASLFSDRDLAGTYDADEAIAIQLNGDSAVCSSSAVQIDGPRITITSEGVYLITGTLTDGQIVVDAADTDKVQLVLAGADITSSTSAAIYALEADKVFVTLAEGSENSLANGGEYVAIDDNNIDAVIFAKTDLTLNGTGSLTINAAAGHGVVSKDDLIIAGGSYTVSAASHGLCGKDVLAIAGGTFTVTSGKDGLHAENTDDLSLGSLYIADGSFAINAQGDAISASVALQIDGGTFVLTTGDGSESVTMSTGDSFEPRSSEFQQTAGTAEETDTTSQKGIKAEGTMTINGGTFTSDTVDDSLHAGGDLLIAAGEFTISSGDDAIHSDSNVTIQGGNFSIPYCYEGIEGLALTFDGGTFNIVSFDDGLNAAGGADGSGFGGGRGDQFAASSDSYIIINGGTFTIVSEGDCVDSNGDLTINGGTLYLTCNGSGNTTLDTDGTYTNNGGSVTTNDGAESNPGGMTGAMGGRGGSHGGELPATDGSVPSDLPQKTGRSDQEMTEGSTLPDGTPPDNAPAAEAEADSTESSSV